MKNAFANLRGNAKRRGLEFALTLDDFRAFSDATGYLVGRGTSKFSLSIDRIDARLGYRLDNIRVLTLSENSTKGNQERKHVFRNGVRVPWEDVDISEFSAAENERRKGFVPYFQQATTEHVASEEDEETEFLERMMRL